MKRRILIVFAVVLIITQAINIYFVAKTYNRLSDHSSKVEEVQDAIIIKNESSVMNIEQASDYVGVTAEQLKKKIQIEKNQLDSNSCFRYELLQYWTGRSKMVIF